MDFVKKGDNILVIWNNSEQNDIANFVNEIKSIATEGNVFLENSTMISDSEYCMQVVR